MALNTKTTAKKRSIQKKRSLSEFFTNRNKKIGIGLVLALVAVGVYFLFFASAATNNCQAENGVQICDVDQTAGGGDSVLSLYGEAESLANQGWGIYYGAAFRAPTSAYDGAVPVHRFLNGAYSWHEFTTDAQLGQKEAKAGGRDKLTYEGIVFYAWTDGHRPGTVPVYRMTRGGAETQSMFSTDKAWIDKMVAGPWGWKTDDIMPSVAFYAYPPSYTVAGLANPYDCSILENFTSPRCAPQAANLQKGIETGAVTASTECPKDWASWNNNAFPGKLPQECQDKWNKYATDCSNADVFQSDRCKAEREALAAANAAQIAARDKASKGSTSGSQGGSTSSGGGKPKNDTIKVTIKPVSNPTLACPGSVEAWKKLNSTQKSQTGKDCNIWWNTIITKAAVNTVATNGSPLVCPKNVTAWNKISVLARGAYGKNCNEFWTTYLENRMPKGVVPTVPKSSFNPPVVYGPTAPNKSSGSKKVKASQCKSSVANFLRDVENGLSVTTAIGGIPNIKGYENVSPISKNLKNYKNGVYTALDAGSCISAESIVASAYPTVSGYLSTLSVISQTARSLAGQGVGIAITSGLKVVSTGEKILSAGKAGLCIVTNFICL